MSDTFKKKIDELRFRLMEDMSPGDLSQMQLKVDTLVRLAMLDSGHDHDTEGGAGHHDHTALADLSWRLEVPRQTLDLEKKKK
jgi:hypothetical protein